MKKSILLSLKLLLLLVLPALDAYAKKPPCVYITTGMSMGLKMDTEYTWTTSGSDCCSPSTGQANVKTTVSVLDEDGVWEPTPSSNSYVTISEAQVAAGCKFVKQF